MAIGQFVSKQALAQRLITKFGRAVEFRQTSETPLNPAEPYGDVGPDTVTTGVPMVFVGYEQEEMNDTSIQMGDKKALVAHLDLGFRPSTKDKIRDGSVDWNIISVDVLEPGERTETIMYTLQVRS